MGIFKQAKKCWGGYLFLLLLYWPFLFAIAFRFPRFFTVLMSLGYFCGAYSLGWRAGKHDVKYATPSLKSAFFGGFFGIIISVITLFIMIIGEIFGQSDGVFSVASDIYRFLHFHFLYFINNFGGHIIVHIIPVVLVLILYPLGYYFGTKGKSIIDKYFPMLLYKKKDN